MAQLCQLPESGGDPRLYIRTWSGSNWTVSADSRCSCQVPSGFGILPVAGFAMERRAGDAIAAQIGSRERAGSAETRRYMYSSAAPTAHIRRWRNWSQRPWSNGDLYGWTIAMSGDGATMSVGDFTDNGKGTGPRAAALYAERAPRKVASMSTGLLGDLEARGHSPAPDQLAGIDLQEFGRVRTRSAAAARPCSSSRRARSGWIRRGAKISRRPTAAASAPRCRLLHAVDHPRLAVAIGEHRKPQRPRALRRRHLHLAAHGQRVEHALGFLELSTSILTVVSLRPSSMSAAAPPMTLSAPMIDAPLAKRCTLATRGVCPRECVRRRRACPSRWTSNDLAAQGLRVEIEGLAALALGEHQVRDCFHGGFSRFGYWLVDRPGRIRHRALTIPEVSSAPPRAPRCARRGWRAPRRHPPRRSSAGCAAGSSRPTPRSDQHHALDARLVPLGLHPRIQRRIAFHGRGSPQILMRRRCA